MKRVFLALCLPVMLAACLGATSPPAAPAPLAQTAVDEKALVTMLKTYDLALTAVDVGVDAGIIKGARAAATKAALEKVSAALGAARAAVKAGNAQRYDEAIANATEAIAEAQRALSS